ncbi:HEAT repeat domain-containing protein [Paenibacillus sp. GP183]|uniref:HEAT repeat domain-containing protein n=1 Tax=Paenibacillus sp. GP183 TaxID=1882751 RepID=UPI000895FA0C|nr:HEAT repeat domain-containing protein [Paenibacillus sp. GP183]SEB92474.1 HEAT repeat-containing protein [Paenibacillus sp. GP183]
MLKWGELQLNKGLEKSVDLDLLREAIVRNKMDTVESMLEEIGRNKLKEAIPLLIEYLKSTDSNILRNSIAITLSDIGSEEAIEPLIDMINHPKTLGARGTLLYALKPFDCSRHLETLVFHLITGNFEVQAEAYQLIEAMNSEVSDEILLKSILKVKDALNEIERQHQIISDTLEKLFSLKKI